MAIPIASRMWYFDISRWSKRNILSLFLTSAVFILLFYSILKEEDGSYAKSPFRLFKSQPRNETLDLSYLEMYEITSKFTYARRMIETKYYDGERPDLTVVNETLFPRRQPLEKGNLSNQEIITLPPLALHVPSSPKVDLSVMSFGIATNIDRLNDTIPQISHWLPKTGALLHIAAPRHDGTLTIQETIRSLSINLTISTSDLPFAKAYFSLVKLLYESRAPNTKWLVLIDDDTFIPSLPTLVSHLSTTYDDSKEVLVAAMSDDLHQIKTFGLLPFGGGGIFMSVPLAARLASPAIYDACIASEKNQGDQIFNDCLNLYTNVKPSFDHGLNQMDILGPSNSSAGYFESGRRMLTVHHWKSWFHVNVPMAAKVSQVCGDEGVFMRWLFDGDAVLSNGFSIVEYVDGIEEADLRKVEKTWEGPNSRFLHHIGPLREALAEDRKLSYGLVEAEVLDGVGIRQIYLHKSLDDEDGQAGTDGVLELLWLF